MGSFSGGDFSSGPFGGISIPPGGTGFGAQPYGTGGGLPYVIPSLGYYLSLLTSQYQNALNLIAFLTACLQPFIDAGMLIAGMVNAFDLHAAIGSQLDMLGQIIGVGRAVTFQPTGGVSPILDDSTYRILLMAKIAQNQWNGSIDSLYSLWPTLFPGGQIAVIDNQNMSATIILSGAFTSILQDLISNGLIIPRPQGVQYNYEFPTLPVFGFGASNAYIAGFGTGHWAG